MKIRNGRMDELSHLMEIYAGAREYMAANGNPRQWGAINWPPEALIKQDIETGHCFVCEEDEKAVAVFYYNYGYQMEPSYNSIDGAWKGEEEYGVVHRIASDRTVKGAGRFCINWAFEQCGHLRIDTHDDNKIMQNLLASMGFERCGIIWIEEDNDPRIAYEKIREEL